MASLPDVHLTCIDQCIYGAKGTKPTGFFHAHLPELDNLLKARGHNGRCHHPRGTHRPLRGLQREGGWRTAEAKVYPSSLCQALGCHIADRIAVLRPWLLTSMEDPDPSLASLFAPLDEYGAQRTFAPDTFRSAWTHTA